MELNKDAEIDTSQVTDARGRGGFGGGGLGGIPVGGGIVGTLIVVALVILGTVVGPRLMDDNGAGNLAEQCSTANPDRLNQAECRNTLYVNSIQNYWQQAMPQTYGKPYQATDTVFFSQAVATGCGNADSGVGPFYCPNDRHVYIDLSFYDELARRFGAKGQFAQAYVLAHEYGHHIQNLVGISAQVHRQQQRDPDAANQLSVRLELQADCLAGVWAKHASSTTDAKGVPIFKNLTQADINEALDAAAAIGDDQIQRKTGVEVDESKFTHGTAQQRRGWFSNGYESGDGQRCDTFSGAI
jgi:predicted metalloprotease